MGEKQLINRKIYKEIKRYDRQEMENFLANIYHQGYQDGVKDGDNADFKIKLVEILEKTKLEQMKLEKRLRKLYMNTRQIKIISIY